jgi:hypothetical protein
MNRLKQIFDFASIVWVFGGGFFIALLCLIWTWKLALVVFCLWALSGIIGLVWAITGK